MFYVGRSMTHPKDPRKLGVSKKVSEPKKLREVAGYASKQVKWLTEKWWSQDATR